MKPIIIKKETTMSENIPEEPTPKAQLIQDWVDGTYPNYGMLIRTENISDTVYIYSSENFNETSYPRPKLYIEYTPEASESARRKKIILGGQ
jgi:hypothetical protein